jgi:subtilase family serine protease
LTRSTLRDAARQAIQRRGQRGRSQLHGVQDAAGGGRQPGNRPHGRVLTAAGLAGLVLSMGALGAFAVQRPARPASPLPPHARLRPGAPAQAVARGAPAGGLTPKQITAAYNLGPLRKKGVDGSGQTIVIVDSFGSPTIGSDLRAFDKHFGLPSPPAFTVITPAGRVPAFTGSSNRIGWAQETTLDVEWSHVMAPGARIVLVETPTSENEGTSGFPAMVKAEKYVLRHHLGQVISQSFAATEQTFSAQSDYAALRDLRGADKVAERDHVTVLAASGDNGATSQESNMNDLYTSRAVSWPATDPLVTAVGGTQLDLRANGTRRKADVAWSDSGGGRSIVFGRPADQNGVAGLTGGHRGVPDISMDASCNSAVAIYTSFGGIRQWTPICGTSLATPLFAGIVAMADQTAGHGKAHGLGLINQALYTMAARHDRGIVDILKGNNTEVFDQGGKVHTVQGFAAGKGYDLISGVGTVNAAYFVPELAKLAG